MYTGNYRPTMDVIHPIVMEASSPEDRKYMRSMSKDDIHQVNGTLVQSLYKNALDRKNVDFGEIPDSKGDITKFKHYETNMECLDILTELTRKNNLTEPAIDDVRVAVSNCKKFSQQFTYAFKMKQDSLILLYNTTVMAIVDVTSMLVATYMDYVVGPDAEPYRYNNKFDSNRGTVSLDNLRKFNTMCSNHTIDDAIDYTLREQKSGFTGTGVLTVTVATIAALTAMVLLIRELIFWYSRTKISLSEYLELQAHFLEMHKLAVENSRRPAGEKKSILKKQERVILNMRKLSDKLKINTQEADVAVRKDIQKENSMYSLNNMEKTIAKNKLEGSGNIQII